MTNTPTRRADTPCKIRAGDDEQDAPAWLDMAKLRVRLTDAPKPLPDFTKFEFGAMYSDHIAITSFNPTTGWSSPEIKPYGPLTLDPASSCLQYANGMFEGMKGYLGHDGKVRLFRPEMNMRRLERSAARLALPPVDGDAVLELIKRLVQIEKRWIPALPGYSLYLRPTMIGTRSVLGIAASDDAILYIIATPAGPYFAHPISLLAVSHAVRAWPGGTGGHKLGSNYAPTFLPQRVAAAAGYDHVLWLLPGNDGKGDRVTEGGAMNIFVVVDREDGHGWDVFTHPLDGTILPGVTRASCLELLSDPAFVATVASSSKTKTEPTEAGTESEIGSKAMALHPAERAFTIQELAGWVATHKFREVFCVGTAVLVCAIHKIGFEGRDLDVRPADAHGDEHGLGAVGRTLRAWLVGVQDGTLEYNGWGVVCA